MNLSISIKILAADPARRIYNEYVKIELVFFGRVKVNLGKYKLKE